MSLFGPPNTDRLKAKRNIKGLAKALRYPKSAEVRIAAAKALAELAGPAAVEPLIAALADEDERVCVQVATAMATLASAPGAGLGGTELAMMSAALTEALSAGQHDLLMAIFEALGAVGDTAAVQTLIAAWKERTYDIRGSSGSERVRIEWSIASSLPVRAAGAVLAVLDHPDLHRDLRAVCVEALGRFPGEQSRARLRAVLEEQEAHLQTQKAALRALVGIDSDGALPFLARALWHPDPDTRGEAASLLDERHLKQLDQETLAASLAAQRRWDECVRIGEPAVRALVLCLQTEPNRAAVAALTLTRIEGAGTDALLAVLESGDKRVRAVALKACEAVNEPRVVKRLVGILASERDHDTLELTCRALCGQKDPRALAAVRALVPRACAEKDGHAYLAEALAKLGGAAAVSDLLACAASQNLDLSRFAYWALVELGFSAVRPLLDQLRDGSTGQAIADQAEKALVEILAGLSAGSHNRAVVTARLARRLADPAGQERIKRIVETADRKRSGKDRSGQDLRGECYKGADLAGVDFREADLSGASLDGANLTEAILDGAQLHQARLPEADLSRASLVAASAGYAWLRKAVLKDAVLDEATLASATFSGANLQGASLKGIFASDANFEGADMRRADLQEADLAGAHLEKAVLAGANLQGANLFNAHLDEADLTGADLECAHLGGSSEYSPEKTTAEFRRTKLDRARVCRGWRGRLTNYVGEPCWIECTCSPHVKGRHGGDP